MSKSSETELHGKKIGFPEAKALADLFSDVRKPEGESPIVAEWPSWEAGTWSDRSGRTKSRLAGYLSVRDPYRWYHVTPRPEVVEYVRENMLHCSNDTITFEAVVWDDGRALVIARYGQIIGSHYLAIIDASTIPVAEDE